MKQILIAVFTALGVATSVGAQTLKFGHLETMAILEAMPEAQEVQKIIDDESNKIESQLTVLQEDFSKMYKDVEMQAQNNQLSERELEEKQQELEETYSKIQEFVAISRQSLQQKQSELIAPLIQKLNRAIEAVGANNDFTYIFDYNVSYIPVVGAQSIDVAPLVKKQLGLQ